MGAADMALSELEKYVHVYDALPTYRMGGARKVDATEDLAWAYDLGCRTYMDIGCGRGEMLDIAGQLGFEGIHGVDFVPALCDGERVKCLSVMDLGELTGPFDMVSSFDVIEHLPRGDEEHLIVEMARLAGKALTLTANNRPSIDPTSGNDLHINIRPYDEWDRIIRDLLEPDWQVQRVPDKQYVSETWRAWR
jgi:SAM-dependent methyltransferase